MFYLPLSNLGWCTIRKVYLNVENNVAAKQKEPQEKWQRPNTGKLKLNCDVAIREKGKIVYGFTLGNEFGREYGMKVDSDGING